VEYLDCRHIKSVF